MALLTDAELKRIESKHANGIASAQVVKIFRGKKERFSEATLRKYVQLGLLPTSRRVGIAGRHRGSSGLYPTGVVRLVNEIKRNLEAGVSLDSIRTGPIGLQCELQQLQRHATQFFERVKGSVDALRAAGHKATLKSAYMRKKKIFDQQTRELEKLVGRIGKSAQA
jgi:DNA-binding transcriptional MerR regulator